MKIRKKIIVQGRVQGIGFRYFIRTNAFLTEVNGYVKNLCGDKVEVVFEGEEGNVNEMIELCKKGPPGAEIIKFDINNLDYTGEFKNFSIVK